MLYRRIIHMLLIPMAIILPLVLTFGRGAFGSGGWMTLIFLFTLAPAMGVGLLVLAILVRLRPDVKAAKAVGKLDAGLISLLYLDILAFSFFVVDGGDTADSINSVAMSVFGRQFENASSSFAGIALVILLFLAGITLLYAVYELLASRTNPGSRKLPMRVLVVGIVVLVSVAGVAGYKQAYPSYFCNGVNVSRAESLACGKPAADSNVLKNGPYFCRGQATTKEESLQCK